MSSTMKSGINSQAGTSVLSKAMETSRLKSEGVHGDGHASIDGAGDADAQESVQTSTRDPKKKRSSPNLSFKSMAKIISGTSS